MEKNFAEGKTILVTGATDGIGYATAKHLTEEGAHVLLHGRSKEKGIDALTNISRASCSGRADLYLADFSSFSDIQRMANEIKRENKELHVLINNAGDFYKKRSLTDEGIEMTFAVNHLAPFLLTLLLLDLIKTSAPARIINVSSSAHKMIKQVDFDNLQGEKHYDPFEAYALSKLGNVLFSQLLSRRLAGSGVTVNSLHPGVVNTKLLKKSYDLDGISIEEGAETQIMLATAKEVGAVSGRYFQNSQEKRASDVALDENLQERFWQVSEALVRPYLK
jgi:NAD(P)-dependent dehydrogenase (short-subunit alcohol dehydrogenase family)